MTRAEHTVSSSLSQIHNTTFTLQYITVIYCNIITFNSQSEWKDVLQYVQLASLVFDRGILNFEGWSGTAPISYSRVHWDYV